MGIYSELDSATLKLFKGVVVDPRSSGSSFLDFSSQADAALDALKYGVTFENSIFKALKRDRFINMAHEASRLYGADEVKLNSSFYKTIESVKELSTVQRFLDQQRHYDSTYGDSSNGRSIYEPEEMEIAEIDADFKNQSLVIIHALTKDEVSDRIKDMLVSGTALKSETIENIMTIVRTLKLDIDYIDEIKNREAMCLICDRLNLIPKKFDEFTRFLVYKVTGQTLLVKNRELYDRLDIQLRLNAVGYLIKQYVQCFGKSMMAKNITRYRKLYLLVRKHSNPAIKTLLNQVFKMSKKMYVPRKQSVLDNFYNPHHNAEELERAMENATPARLLQIMNAGVEKRNILFHANSKCKYRLFRIRNGKSYLKQDTNRELRLQLNLWNPFRFDKAFKALVNKLSPLDETLFYIPRGMEYVVPTSEKNFIGGVPQFSAYYVRTTDRALVGISWDEAVDLDLHAHTLDGHHVGWNSDYDNGGITYSGDMTSLNEYGYAAEYLAIDPKKIKEPLIVEVSYYGSARMNWEDLEEVNFDIFATAESVDTANRTPIISQIGDKSLLVHDKISTKSRSKVLIYIKPDEEYRQGIGVYFINQNYGNVRVPDGSNKQEVLMGVLDRKINSQLPLGKLICDLGGTVVTDKEEFKNRIAESKEEFQVTHSKAIGDIYSPKNTDPVKAVDLSPQNVTADQMLAFLKVKDE